MARNKYVKPGISSERVFTLTSQACTTNGDPSGLCEAGSGALLWTPETCAFLLKTISLGSCDPQIPQSEIQYS